MDEADTDSIFLKPSGECDSNDNRIERIYLQNSNKPYFFTYTE